MWLAFFAVTLPVMLERTLVHGLDLFVWKRPLVAAFIVNDLIGVTVGALVGLMEVVLTYELLRREPRAAPTVTASGP